MSEECKYYNDTNVPNNTSVWFKTLDENDAVIMDYAGRACFSDLTYYKIDPRVKKILIYHTKQMTPYKFDAIKRWIEEINLLGFPCECLEVADKYEFIVKLSDYTWKAHLISTLMLIRALYEYGINKVPEFYLTALDKNATLDRFELLQLAHKDPRLNRYSNTNHMITSYQNGSGAISKQELHSRYEKCGVKIYDGKSGWHSIGQADKWRT